MKMIGEETTHTERKKKSGKPWLIVMCGLSGSGKSTIAKKIAGERDAVIISSDELRKELFGNEAHQEDKNMLFAEYNKRVRTALERGVDVIADKTNLSIRSRRSLLEVVKDIDIRRKCVICNIPFEKCLENNSARVRHVPEEAIRRQLYGFQVPFQEEGFDSISILPRIGSINYDLMVGFEQKTPYHNSDLFQHSTNVSNLVGEKYLEWKDLSFFHDVGKLYTQKIGKDGIAHYVGHDSVGAYKILNDKNLLEDSILPAAFLANYHMLPFQWNTRKSQEKWRKIFGDEKYEMLLYFNKCDRER